METAAAPARPRPGSLLERMRAAEAGTWAKAAFALLCLAYAVGIVVYPTYPNYDSYYSLLWGRELLDGVAPHFEGFRHPTEHPLAIAAGALLSLFGESGDRLWIALTFAGYLALVAGVYRLAATAFTPLVGAIAAAILLTRFQIAFLAARGYIDVPYLALVVWAVALEARRPRRGAPVFALLTAAGLLRPEAWLLAGLYFLWMFPRSTWGQRAAWALWAAAAPVGWCLVDLAVTGDPLFSLHYTSDSAEDLGRSRELAALPAAIPQFLGKIVKSHVLYAGAAGAVAALVLVPRRALWPAVLLLSGAGTFLAIGVAGMSAIERYLLAAAIGLIVLAAFALGGWTMLERGSRLRRAWAAAALLALVAGGGLMATRLDLSYFDGELKFRGDAHRSLQQVLAAPEVKKALECGPLTLPNHKLVPDARWVAGLPYERVWARAQESDGRRPHPPQHKGVALVVTSRYAIFKHAWTNPADPASVQVPPAGWRRVAGSEHYAAYARC